MSWHGKGLPNFCTSIDNLVFIVHPSFFAWAASGKNAYLIIKTVQEVGNGCSSDG
jgi:hypothetical protein